MIDLVEGTDQPDANQLVDRTLAWTERRDDLLGLPDSANAPPGLYRFVLGGMTLEQQDGNKVGWGSPLVLTSEFNVLPSQG
ncbi:MAG TPA: hypothetical protein VLK56_01410 [Solirubrobacterales bacterium]|nr:hypothetical protein [Solirubrobacterales bacterium]